MQQASTITEVNGPENGTGSDPVAVLLVDDNHSNLLVLESVLKDEDYLLVKAQTAADALLALMNKDFAAVVLDVQMPDIDGIELARLIKQRKRTRHVPIIFLTAHHVGDEHARLGYDAGAVDYLIKPLHPAVLRSKVGVFADLFRKTRALEKANAKLEARTAALQRESEERARRIQAEAAKAEAEAANAAKDRFLAMLSHELRTPLTPIIYASALLENDANCPPHVREAMETIRRNVRLEVRLIDDLLDLARIRSGKLALELQNIDSHEALRDAIQICVEEGGQRSIAMVERLDASNTHVHGDPARLRQIFWNLLKNAVKFTPDGGTITVHSRNEDGFLIVEITDTGMGIEAQKLDRIFDAFEQVTQTASVGLGLGLAICRALVELHAGTIEARSEGLGRGASFVVRLPSAEEIIMPKVIEHPEGAGAVTRILLVDDHRDTADVLSQLLEVSGYEVRTASSVANAMQVAAGYDFEILISDIGLPDGRGTDLLKQLQEKAGGPVRAIAMSGFGMEEDRVRSSIAGFAEHLVKPVEISALQKAIKSVAGARESAAGRPA